MSILLSLMGVAALYGTALTLWHRKLMIDLRQKHPTIWRQMAPLKGNEKIWSYSTSFPIWSWRSLLFFLRKKYTDLDDPGFISRARRFRLVLISWLILLAALTVSAWYWQTTYGPKT
jgi:hypothetical protein